MAINNSNFKVKNGVNVGANLIFDSTGARIQGDFDNATHSNRVAFQTSTANTNTTISAIPNGTATSSQFVVYGSSDMFNSARAGINITSIQANIWADKIGTGSFLPIVFQTSGAERLRIDTAGNVGIGVNPTGLGAKLAMSNDRAINSYAQKWSMYDGATFETDVLLSSNGTTVNFGNYQSFPLSFHTNATERFRIGASGQWGIGGANYGTAGQVLTSGGPSAAPSWTTVAGGSVSASDNQTNASYFPTFATSQGTGVTLATDSGLTYNPSSGLLSLATLNTTGNVGIGGTATASQGTLQAFGTSAGAAIGVARFVNTSATANSAVALSLDPGNNGVSVRDAQIRAINNGSNQIDLTFHTSNAAAPTERMRISYTGRVNVGVNGATNPSLHNFVVNSNICAQSQHTTDAATLLAGAHDFYASSWSSVNITYYGKTTAGTMTYNSGMNNANGCALEAINTNGLSIHTNNGDISFATEGVQRMRLSQGNVGIGISAPTVSLEVRKNATGSNVLQRTGILGQTKNPYLEQIFDETNGIVTLNASGSSTPNFTFNVAGTERMRIDNAGNVAIGGSTAYSKLDVYGSGTIRGFLTVQDIDNSGSSIAITSTDGSYTGLTVANGSSTIALTSNGAQSELRTGTNTPIVFMTNNLERMRINEGGAVWIGGTLSSSDITSSRAATPTTGYIYFGNTGTKYFGFDGSNCISSMPMWFNILGTAVNLSTTRSTWSTNGTISAVVGQLAWKNYGNGHSIFDASAGTSPDGTAVNSTNSTQAWTASFPTLMGWNGSQTYGVRVDSARVADDSSAVGGISLANICSGTNGAAATDTISDMNNVTTQKSGFYLYNGPPANAPVASHITWMTAMGHYAGDRYGWQMSKGYWDDNFYLRELSSNSWGAWKVIVDSVNVGSYALPIGGGTVTGNFTANGQIYTGGWFRSSGAQGWYNESYGGGIYMSDSAYVRTYNNKSFLAHSYVEVANNYGAVSGAQNINVLNGSMVSMTLNGATTYTFSGAPASGNAASFTLELTNGGAYTVTWPSGTKWSSGAAPTLTASGTDILTFYTRDGGTTWRGVMVSKDSR
jgi:hypothetical protein